MADHVRKQLREAAALTLAGLDTTGARVFTSRVYPLERADLPGLLVRVAAGASETVEPQTVHSPRMLERVMPLEVVGVARAVDDLDDTLDQIAKEVEVALASPASVLAIAKDIVLRSTTVEMVDGTEKPLGTVTLQYDINYFTHDNAPDVAL
jgi:hypothetical protein